jgi:phage terminase small subunit
MAAKTLTPKQEAFCQKYIETGSGAEAYRQAYSADGMRPNTIACRARDELVKPHVAARVADMNGSAMVAATMGKAKLAGLDKAVDPDGEGATPTAVTVTIRDARADA